VGHKIGVNCNACFRWKEHGEYIYCKGCGRAVCVGCLKITHDYGEFDFVVGINCPACNQLIFGETFPRE
jgi:hypothetical protein